VGRRHLILLARRRRKGIDAPLGIDYKRIVVESIVRQGQQLAVTPATKPASGAEKCWDKSPTYALLVGPKTQFKGQYARRGDVRIAPA
jgi:hypothetical protein